LKEHAKAAHPDYFFEQSGFSYSQTSGALAIMSCFGELFTYCLRKRDGRYYGAVQLIGTSSEASKYKCEFTLSAANGIEKISKTFLVQGYTEEFETIFNSGNCLNLDEQTVKKFVVENKLKLNTKLCAI